MEKERLMRHLHTIIDEYLSAKGFQLVDFILRYEGRDLFLRILADWPQGGITVAECASLNNELSNLLDEKNLLDRKYILEVSSPGLDRPLKSADDFRRALNRSVRVFLTEPLNEKIELAGEIIEVQDDKISLKTDSATVTIGIEQVNKAKQIIE